LKLAGKEVVANRKPRQPPVDGISGAKQDYASGDGPKVSVCKRNLRRNSKTVGRGTSTSEQGSSNCEKICGLHVLLKSIIETDTSVHGGFVSSVSQ